MTHEERKNLKLQIDQARRVRAERERLVDRERSYLPAQNIPVSMAGSYKRRQKAARRRTRLLHEYRTLDLLN